MEITVIRDGQEFRCRAAVGERLLEILRAGGVYIAAPCGGAGRCGNCRVRFLSEAPPPAAEDKQKLTPAQLAAGWRLACVCRVQAGAVISLDRDESAFAAEAVAVTAAGQSGRLGIALDIGTTTLAAALVDLRDGGVLAVHTGVNHQRSFGADVISRIQAAGQGHADELRTCICRDVDDLLSALLRNAETDATAVERLVIAANTTMIHLLCGYDATGLGRYPFTAVELAPPEQSYRELTGGQALDCPVSIVPGISAFVGGDIVAGLIACDLDKTDQPRLFIDLGTNGEMALCHGDKVTVTSVAAGPAFEGGRLSAGVGSVPGAICRVSLRGMTPICETIGGQPPIGLCGTGAIEALTALRTAGVVDETGLLSRLYPNGFSLAPEVALTQADIRELQMAKAAVRAGAEILLQRVGLTAGEVESVVLAGGFGAELDIRKAEQLGMLPEGWTVTAAGNTSLKGAIRLAVSPEEYRRAMELARRATELSLATDPQFMDRYVEMMDL